MTEQSLRMQSSEQKLLVIVVSTVAEAFFGLNMRAMSCAFNNPIRHQNAAWLPLQKTSSGHNLN
jgi:hypothetical protein